ncbi:MAG: sulfotransferase [Phycisphaerales bacterium]
MAQPGRNDPCPCGSGRKYKKCCMANQTTAGATARHARASGAPSVSEGVRKGVMARRAGRFDEAARQFNEALRRNPRDALAAHELGMLTAQFQDLKAGLELVRRAVTISPSQVTFRLGVADLLHRAGRFDESKAEAEAALRLEPGNLVARLLVADALEKSHELEEALVAVERAASVAADDPRVAALSGRVLRRLGRHKDAVERLRVAVERDNGSAPAAIRARLRYELGAALERLGAADDAFIAFRDAGRLTISTPEAQALDRTELTRLIDAHSTALTKDRLDAWRRRGAEASFELAPPIFLIGFHRSGTTLLEQMLAARPGLVSSGEAPALHQVHHGLHRGRSVTEGLETLDTLSADDLNRWRREYFTLMAKHTGYDSSAGRLLDKQPLNTVYLALIAALFPDAKVVMTLRDPRDVCLSCFMQDFRLDNASVHMTSLDGAAALYAKVMQYWMSVQARWSLDTLVVRYEDFVRLPETEGRRLFDFLNLEWSDDATQFQEIARDRVIATPSYEAVTQAINTKAIGRWRRYRDHMAPALERLQPFVESFGYEDESS